MLIHPLHTPTARNDFVALQKLMDNIKRGDPAGAMTPAEVEAEEARRFEQHAKENCL